MQEINKEMLILDALAINSEKLVPVMQSHGLGCFGCPSARGKSLERAAEGHGVDIDALIKDMNAALA